MIAVTTTPPNISIFRKFNVWYTIKDGNWSDPGIWMSNGSKRYGIPQAGDDVYVNHTVDYNNSLGGTVNGYLFNNQLNNIFIAGKLTATGSGLNQNRLVVKGNLECSGTIDFSTTTSVIVLELRGTSNYIANFNTGSASTIQYNSPFSQNILPITYYNLQISNSNTKYLIGDVVTNGVLTIDNLASLELGTYNSTFNGALLQGTLKKASSTGFVNFTGSVFYSQSTGAISFSGSPTVSISGNIGTDGTGDFRGGSNFGSGILNVLTNQTWTPNTAGNFPVSFGNVSIVIASGKTLTINSPGLNIGGLLINGTSSVNGTDGTSTLNINGAFAYGNTSVPMTTGLFNYNNSGTSQIIVYTGVTMTLPFVSFYDLTIYGIATLLGNTIVSHNLNIAAGNLQLAAYNFSVAGTMSYAGSLLKSGTGTINLNIVNCQNSTGSIIFSSTPTVNLSGNISGDVRNGFNFGTGVITVTSSLSIAVYVAGNVAPSISWNILIASGKTLTNIGINSTLGGINTTGTITGTDGTAVFDNRSVLNYNNALAPMNTGKLYCNQAANSFIYGLIGNQDINSPSDSIPGYQNLTLNGSGIKRLLGNVSVKGNYILTSPATLNLNGFSLTNP